MASPLACIGLAVDSDAGFQQLMSRVSPDVYESVVDGVHVGHWQDDSGAALVLGWRGDEVFDFIPTYTAGAGGYLADCRPLNDRVAFAKVTDSGGEQLTAMTFQAEQHRHLRALGQPFSGRARITALGVAVGVYPDAEAFTASPASQLDPPPGKVPPPGYLERGGLWPPLLGAESFISYGVFDDPARAGPQALLSGIVLKAAPRVCVLTGQPFTVATVHTAGFAADVCLAASEHPAPPAPGAVISGTVSLTAAFTDPLPCGCPA
jgi:hypothetical protein